MTAEVRTLKSYWKNKCKACFKTINKGAEIKTGGWTSDYIHAACHDAGPPKVDPVDVSNFTYSDEQERIFELMTGPHNVLVNAGAGCGKTFTIIHGALRLSGRMLYISFNKSIAVEMEEKTFRMGLRMDVKTSHSVGFNGWKAAKNIRKCRINGGKLYDIIEAVTPGNNKDDLKARYQLKKLASLWKNIGGDPCDIAMEHDIELDDTYIDKYLPKVIEKNDEIVDIVDFDDMIYFAATQGAKHKKYDYIFVDECQDLNNRQLDMIHAMQSTGAKFVFVGDPAQAIYAFRGANDQCFDTIREKFHPSEATLSVTRRCGKAIVDFINSKDLKSGFKAAESNPEGEIIHTKVFEPNSGDLVMCRLRAPLLPAFYECVKNNKPSIIVGRDFGAELISMIEGFGVTTIEKLYDGLDKWESKQIERLTKRVKDPERRGVLIENVCDKTECVRYLAEDVADLYDLKDKIKKLFSDSDEDNVIKFTSIHSAKGLEADTCWVLAPEKLPLYHGGQEQNIEYVCYSRAINKLIFLEN